MGVKRRAAAIGAALVIIGLACDEATGPLDGCLDAVELRATSGTSPEFSWSPACGAQSLVVDPLPPSQGFGMRWGLATADRLVEPPVRYRQVKSGTLELGSDAPLEEGQEYQVFLHGEGGEVIGTLRRTP